MEAFTDSWRAHTGRWYITIDAPRPLTLDEARALRKELNREIYRAESNDADPGEA